MITYIKGRLCEKTPTSVVIEANGIGYIINISLSTFSQIPDNENINTNVQNNLNNIQQNIQLINSFLKFISKSISKLILLGLKEIDLSPSL